MRMKHLAKPMPEINMIPMIDVIMMLLIFFLVATQMKKEESAFDLQLPESVKAMINLISQDSSPVTVNIISAKYAAPNKHFVVAGAELSKDELTLALREITLRAKQRGDKGGEDTIVRIRADRDSQLEDLQTVLICCQKAEIYKVYIAAEKPRG
jgi:biopolymer transport protein ExbD